MMINRHGRPLIGNRIPFQCEGFGQTESEVVKELLESAIAGAVEDRHGLGFSREASLLSQCGMNWM